MVKKYMLPKHEEWLNVAEDDLIAAAKLIKDDDATLGPAIFHTQQCAEKALKAYLAYKKQTIVKTHDLVQLVKKCNKFDAEFQDLIDSALELNPYVVSSRYPDDCLNIPFRDEVVDALKHASAIWDFVRYKIPHTRER